jgi:hypothetical protein
VRETREVEPFEEGGGDARRFEVRQQAIGHWLVRNQLMISQVELPTELKKREQLEKLRDLDHCLTQDGRFRGILFQVRHMPPGRQRNQTRDNLWASVYDGYHIGDLDCLKYHGIAPSE